MIGIYSGAFDPVHDGHVALAQKAIDELDLNVLYMIAEPSPRRKFNVIEASHRQAMLKLSVSGLDKIKTELPGMNDQHDVAPTLKLIDQVHPGDKLTLVMGADVFLNIDKWPDYQKLIDQVEFFVALRTEDDGEELVYKLLELPEAKVTKIVTDFPTVTSSKIRQDLAEGKEPKNLNPKVLAYIRQHNLYF